MRGESSPVPRRRSSYKSKLGERRLGELAKLWTISKLDDHTPSAHVSGSPWEPRTEVESLSKITFLIWMRQFACTY
ncbi:unnamed protein product [Amoebophrya sp. A25]|nr:unnamed protein product [Amoebophrya sp. A25]|eukprot:GSA25T00015572001.1